MEAKLKLKHRDKSGATKNVTRTKAGFGKRTRTKAEWQKHLSGTWWGGEPKRRHVR